MDEHQSNAEPNTPGKVGISRRTVMDGTLASPPTTLPRATLAASPVDDKKGASIRRRSIMVVTAILAIDIAIPHGMAAGSKAAPPSQAPEYLPSISDLMIATIQPRHERLWQAEQDEIGIMPPTRPVIFAVHSGGSGSLIQSNRTSPPGNDRFGYGAIVQGA